ncbi:hypothetical protein DWUX_1319 [Desulfovibrio diazotrophicus]|nr:hypothetical protein DWUX_1319 [Desulfovibrio diazotrophicus]
MDLQLVLIILCVLVALVFMIRRMRRAMRSGQCGCGCDAKAHPTCNCGGQATIEPLHPEKTEKNKLS